MNDIWENVIHWKKEKLKNEVKKKTEVNKRDENEKNWWIEREKEMDSKVMTERGREK